MSDEKKHDPSAHRLRQARQRGDVPFTRELGTLATTIVGVLLLGPAVEAVPAAFTKVFAELGGLAEQTPAELLPRVLLAARDALFDLLAAALLPLAGTALVAGLLQVGPLFAAGKLAPKFDQLNPFQRLRELFRWRQVVTALRQTVIAALACWLLWGLLRTAFLDGTAELAEVGRVDTLEHLLAIGRNALDDAAWVVLGLLAVGAAFDLWQQRRRHWQQLRMSDQEAKQEHKDQEGDAQLKHARKHKHRELSNQELVGAAREADLALVNPTHITCFLRYDPQRDPAPRILAVGEGRLAKRMKKMARRRLLPVVCNIPLARALRHDAPGTVIPTELHRAAAVVLQWAEQHLADRGRTPRWRQVLATPGRLPSMDQQPQTAANDAADATDET